MPVQVRLRAHAGSLPPVKARRRQNAIDNLNAVSKAASRSGARRDGRSQRDFESLKKSARHLLVRTPLLTQLRIAETHNIKAETANPHAGINAADEKSRRTITCDARDAACSVADLLPATGEVGTAETGRAGTRFPPAQRGLGGIKLMQTHGLFALHKGGYYASCDEIAGRNPPIRK